MTPATATRSPLEAEAEAEADDALGLRVGGMHLPLRLVGGKWVLMPAS